MENNLQSAKEFLSKTTASGVIERKGVGEYSMSFDIDKLASILTTYASQVCADKDREIDALNWAARMNRSDFLKAQSELDKANESLTVMLRENAELEKEVKRFNTMRHDSAFVNNVCLSYRHDFGLVAPKERKLIEFECLEWMRAILNNIEFKPK